jgi:hypothetical protein
MNVNPQSEDFGKVVRWDSLTDEQKASGDWIELPNVADEPRSARLKHAADMLRELFPPPRSEQQAIDDILQRGQFDATGKVR